MKKILASCLGVMLVISVIPIPVSASSGQLIKGVSFNSVYYQSEGKRYAFPNEQTYLSWYDDFLSVTTVKDPIL